VREFHANQALFWAEGLFRDLIVELTTKAILLGCAHDSKQHLVVCAAGRLWPFWPPPGRLDAVLRDRSKTVSRPFLTAPFSNPCYDRNP
jgi:hypothetical protein